jgi:hypothetical protein
VGGDPYELRIVIPAPDRGWRAASAGASDADRAGGVEITWEEADGLVRARIASPTGREVTWAVRFSMERNKP